MTASQQFTRYLMGRRLKVTPERLAIVEAVVATPGHFDVDSMLLRLRRRDVPVSRATLYRTLSHLLDAGMVHRLTDSRGNPRYESMAGRKPHDHMVCLACGAILEFRETGIEELEAAACRKQGFTRTTHQLRIEGYCRHCAGS